MIKIRLLKEVHIGVFLCYIPRNFDNFPIVTINGNVIETSLNIKYLGVIFDSDIKFNTHIMSLCKKANHQLYNIRHIRNYINKNTCRILIKSLVFSIIDYCNSILVGLPNSSLIPINRIIRSTVRLIHRQPRTDHMRFYQNEERPYIIHISAF